MNFLHLVDTHCHLDSEFFDVDRDNVVTRAHEVGVTRIVVPATRFRNIPKVLGISEQYEGVYCAVGIYPRHCSDWQASGFDRLRQAARHERVVAIGEIGLDYSWNNKCLRETQQEVFGEQLKHANDLGLPVIIHNFQSYADCLQLVAASPLAGSDRVGVLHHFTGDYEVARRAIDLGLFLSFAAPVTYKNAKKVPALVAKLPLSRIVIETDAPCLPPHPYRGTQRKFSRNEPAYVRIVAQSISRIHRKSLEETAKITTENAVRLFRLDKE
jgi:TatD DNase family protein